MQKEWDSGRWPLWDPGQTGGEPLLGNLIALLVLAAVFWKALLLPEGKVYAARDMET